MKTDREAYLAGRILLMIKFADANGEFFARSQQIKFNEYAVELANLILGDDFNADEED